jgi:hypothetical protein
LLLYIKTASTDKFTQNGILVDSIALHWKEIGQEYLEAKRLLKFLDYFLPMPSDGINQNSILREFIGGSCFNV